MPRLPVLLALAAFLAACSDPAPPEAPCTGPGCDGGGQGGAGGSDGCPDLAETSPCGFEGLDDACGEEICTLAATSCPRGGRCCTLPLECRPAAGQRPPGVACEEDDDCVSGSCVEISGVRSCLRVCRRLGSEDSCPPGQHCETIALAGGAVSSTCVGGPSLEERDALATICVRPSQCPEGRSCRIIGAQELDLGLTFALCLPPAPEEDWFESCAPAPGVAVSSHGTEQSGQCPMGGLCWDGCKSYDSGACYCTQAEIDSGTCRGFRCTGVCGGNADCPDRSTCQGFATPTLAFADPLQEFAICRLPYGQPLDSMCWDELDCCKNGLRPSGGPCCEETDGICVNPLDPPDATHCRFVPGGGRYLTVCALPEGKALAGQPCADDAGCESGLCVDDGAGGRVCSSPCDVRFDRCADVLPGSSCCPTAITSEDGPHCVPICRFSCESPPGCEAP